MVSSLPKIADSEWRILKVLWKQSPKSAMEIIDALNGEVDWKPKTIKTLLNRLTQKGALGYQKAGRSYLYFPKIDESECKREETRTFINRIFDGALTPMLAGFLEEAKLSPDAIAELRKILEQVEGD